MSVIRTLASTEKPLFSHVSMSAAAAVSSRRVSLNQRITRRRTRSVSAARSHRHDANRRPGSAVLCERHRRMRWGRPHRDAIEIRWCRRGDARRHGAGQQQAAGQSGHVHRGPVHRSLSQAKHGSECRSPLTLPAAGAACHGPVGQIHAARSTRPGGPSRR